MKKTLFLSLKKEPFDVMVTGEKSDEYRKPSKWIKSRLLDKDYDVVKMTNGYGPDKRYFIAEYYGFKISSFNQSIEYSNGLIVNVGRGDIIISLGEIIETGNL
jgi:CRISPR/Cas system-associated endonuclease/helicase Cas3